MTAKVRLISIGYSNAFDSDMVDLHVWQEFDSKQKAIVFLNDKKHYPNGLSREQNLELHDLGCTAVGREHYFILYPDEQKQWLKALVNGTIV